MRMVNRRAGRPSSTRGLILPTPTMLLKIIALLFVGALRPA
jgi:hypothetical protein